MYCCWAGATSVALAGVTTIDTSTAGVTVRAVDPLTPPLLAEMVVVPTFSAEAKPAALILAAAAFEDAQLTLLVRFCVDPSLNLPVARNCTGLPAGVEKLAGVTVIDWSTATPLPLNWVTCCPAPSVTVSVPVIGPELLGLK